MNHIHHITFGPFSEYGTIAVHTFGTEPPVIERFHHEHHTQLITQFNQFRSGHIVRCADGVGTHVLQHFNLMAKGGAVDGSTEGAKVMMVAHTFEFGVFAVEEKAFFRNVFQ